MQSIKLLGVAIVAATLITVQLLFLGFLADIGASVLIFGLGYAARVLTERK